ncbi:MULTISPECIES: LPS export ABC transporter periplasmic protein LptC [Acetobacter]|jgi:lipopolysaccharide export system protein LptC|uniref:Lipopolysaccharide export system protein LptC n=1 Tax=Acetobacter lovaniensis TaxID=104100 RepID=A0A841QC62_9PROT|nr:LPS export ABC transporter periplasmic protein LptC [Acetobacter lovaniensis]MBB6455998.1 lipopolysaccharide export system protein LptC [Acetobacter lovaniensis]MCI1697072.1 LPS export ABC transporter periplasmic protein LptC [Acetobacter lovaniensis]MCI1796134.1 LPS export ABC transporter periplasmic protein LptC [Acetobacter lovaniensis]MCP1238172.1 LPS export ABC transporter periplasmic protein LptC [Acetobacter lovaniensis]NHN80386.1 LPS export ABC transporter periplasmic protein LptC [
MTDTPGKRPEREDYARSGVDIQQQRERLAASSIRRRVPDAATLARRRTLLRWAKWLLPATALLLLSAIAVWPEVEHLISANQTTMRELSKVKIESGNLVGATYRGVDEHDRPFTITADTVHQAPSNRLDLSNPMADILTQGGDWLMVRSEKGVYMQHAQILDLTGEVTLYRDDGLMMHTPLADIDIKAGIITSDSWVRAEGPFGSLDARGFLLSQHDGLAQFRGPGRLILNDDRQNDARTGKKAS